MENARLRIVKDEWGIGYVYMNRCGTKATIGALPNIYSPTYEEDLDTLIGNLTKGDDSVVLDICPGVNRNIIVSALERHVKLLEEVTNGNI